MRGKLYCVGVGPGDPELMTLKAKRLIGESGVIAFPCRSDDPGDSRAFCIAEGAVAGLRGKKLLPLSFPMVREEAVRRKAHEAAAELIVRELDAGENVVFLTVGDPMVYCTWHYVGNILKEQGIGTEYVSGVPSFCAAAARLGTDIAEGDEAFAVIPALRGVSGLSGTEDRNLILMKPVQEPAGLREYLREQGWEVYAVEDCGLDTERVWRGLAELPDSTGYFTVMICKKRRKRDE